MYPLYSALLLRRLGAALAALALAGGPALAQTPSFAAQVSVATGANSGSRPNAIALADVNGDGRPDALVSNNGPGTLGVLLGNGAGGFTLQASSPSIGTGTNPFGVAVADVNGDGKLDALVTNFLANNLAVLLGNGAGGFTLQATLPSTGGNNPGALAVADVNGDNRPDVLALNINSSNLGVLLGNGSGGFALQSTLPSTGATVGPNAVAVADVNGDGRPDALVTNGYTSTLAVLLGNGAGGFSLQANPAGTGSASGAHGLALADVNGDGRLDALVANASANTLGVLLGNGAGGFILQATQPSTGAGTGPYAVAVADVNRDGKLDALTANGDSNTLSVLLGNGAGGFTLQATMPSTGASGSPIALAAADVNADAKPDVLVANLNTGTVAVLLNTTVLATRAALPGSAAALAPNPALAGTTLAATGLPAAARTLEVAYYNALGQPVRRLAVPAAAGAAHAELPTATLPAGVYLLRLHALDAQGTTLGALPTQRLVVE